MQHVQHAPIVQFRQWHCRVCFAKYRNGRLAIQLTDIQDDELVATATVNIPDAKFPTPLHVHIKDWSENEGMLEALTEAGIVTPLPYWDYPTGFVTAKGAMLTPRAMPELARQQQQEGF